MGRTRKLWERVAPVIVGAAVVLLFALAGTIVLLQIQAKTFVANAHERTVSQGNQILRVLNEHTATLGEVKALRTEVENLVKQDGPAIQAGQNDLIARLDWLTCAVSSGSAACGPPP